MRRKLAAEKQRQAAGERVNTLSAQAQALERQVDEQQQQLEAMQQKLELLASNGAGPSTAAFNEDVIRNEEIEIALLREKQRRSES